MMIEDEERKTAANLIFKAVDDTLKVSAPGIGEVIRRGICTSVYLKLKDHLVLKTS